MEVTLVGVGLGNPTTLTAAAAAALQQADGLIGSRRLLEECPLPKSVPRKFSTKSAEIVEILKGQDWQNPCVLYSGDTGFYSGARTLVPLLEAEQHPLPGAARHLQPAIFCGTAGPGLAGVEHRVRPWAQLRPGGRGALRPRKAGILPYQRFGRGRFSVRTSDPGRNGPPDRHGGAVSLLPPGGKIFSDSVSRLAGRAFSPLTVLLVEGYTSCRPACSQGLPDEAFLRGDVPMTKQEVRAAAIGKLEVRDGETYWDVGAGTGSVSVELALLAPHSKVCAVECKGEACSLIRANREKFGVYNLELTQGRAPEILAQLPAPDAVFIGGSGGELPAILL